METINDFKQEFKLAGDSGDPWGSCMMAWFECAGQVNKRGLIVPWHWEYRPGIGDDGTDPDCYWYDLFEQTPQNTLLSIGELLSRYASILEFQGKSY